VQVAQTEQQQHWPGAPLTWRSTMHRRSDVNERVPLVHVYPPPPPWSCYRPQRQMDGAQNLWRRGRSRCIV
jgi:hypothetical protein